MTTATIVWMIVSFVLAIFVGGSGFVLARWGGKILVFEKQLNDALDVLDDAHAKVFEITNRHVMNDDPNVLAVAHELYRSRQAILKAAEILTQDRV